MLIGQEILLTHIQLMFGFCAFGLYITKTALGTYIFDPQLSHYISKVLNLQTFP